MYTIFFLVLGAIAIGLLYSGGNTQKRGRIIAGLLVGLLAISLSWFMNFWSEMLWFQVIGYGQRFWVATLTQWMMTAGSALAAASVFFLLTTSIRKPNLFLRWLGMAIIVFIGGTWGYANWEPFLKFWYGVNTGIVDPILEKDTGFYLFTLPFLSAMYGLLVTILIFSLAVTFMAIFISRRNGLQVEFAAPGDPGELDFRLVNAVCINAGILLVLLGIGKYLDRFDLMYSNWGVVQGAGWTDVNIRLPAYNILMVVTVLAGISLMIPATRRAFQQFVMRQRFMVPEAYPFIPGLMLLAVFVLWFVGLNAIPQLFQSLRVVPNEITLEKPYILHNIEFTRQGFNLDKVAEKQFPAADTISKSIVGRNREIFDNIRLWDWRALDEVYRQFQEIRLYYEFENVDVDRYMIAGKYRQVMVSAREMETSNLPAQSQTFVNERFKYTHGYGITLTPVNEFTKQGLPNLLIKNIPPVSAFADLEVKRPEIYYGELTDGYVVVNSAESEFDYPKGEENVYVRYQGPGGVPINNFWRRFIYGHHFGESRLLFSSYPTDSSRVMFHRNVHERVRMLAPFLEFEKDAYITLIDGQLKWIIDAYTTSNDYPYSQPFTAQEGIEYEEGNNKRMLVTQLSQQLRGANYIRNSVKAVVDAYSGAVDFYVYDTKDPLIQVWQKIFPELFKPKEAMPEAIRKHVRYPEEMLLAQGLVFARYHMTDPEVFYNQEDLWVRATEKYYENVQPVEPYYIMWQRPGSDEQEYVLILPFTPKNRQVLIGWIAGMCDPENYGEFIAYQFPKESRVLGPQQVETKIDQDSFLSSQLSLWDQRGSNVIRGNVLAIPVEQSIIYVEPIYLQSETAAYPELRLVAVMHNDNLSYASNFEDALEGLFDSKNANKALGPSPVNAILRPNAKPQQPQAVDQTQTLAQQANGAFNRYLELNNQKRFTQAATELQRLQQLLQQMAAQGGNSVDSL